MKTVSNKYHTGDYNDDCQDKRKEHAVLIVDDDPRVGDVLLEVLKEEGFMVSYATDGRIALLEIERNPPNVVLADMRMPNMDGVTLLHEIMGRWNAIDVIMMSATESPAGLPVPFIQKPFDLDDVIYMVCRCNRAS